MNQHVSLDAMNPPRVGRPRRGTESMRADELIAAIRVFLRGGYALASINKVASEAGVPTRTIYERFKNKIRVDDAIAHYFRGKVVRGALRLADPERAVVLFLQRMCADIHEQRLFGPNEPIAALDFSDHREQVMDIFLNGVVPRDSLHTDTA